MALRIAFLGFGEAGALISAGVKTAGAADIAAWDILFADEDHGPRMRAQADPVGVRCARDVGEAVTSAEIIISAVTTDQSLVAAEEAAPHLAPGTIYIDCNSTSPGKKRRVAEVIEATGAYMVESAVMDTVPPHGHRVPMLLAGAKAGEVVEKLTPLGMQLEALDGGIGQASTIKMCRSVFMKGLPAILFECLVAAEEADATEAVLASIGKTYPGIDWEDVAVRALGGTALHAARRAGEMEEAAITVKELGLEPTMAAATAQRLQSIADLGLRDFAEKRKPTTLDEFFADVAQAREKMAVR